MHFQRLFKLVHNCHDQHLIFVDENIEALEVVQLASES